VETKQVETKQGGLKGGAQTAAPPAKAGAQPLHSTAPGRLATTPPASARRHDSPPPQKSTAKQSRVKEETPAPRTPRTPGPGRDMDALNGQYLGFRNETGQKEGFGVLRGKDGTTYTGQWVNGRRDGHGTLFFNGGVFEGDWDNGNATGRGSVYFKNGDNFVGSYEHNRKHGHGTYHWSDGAEEVGEYQHGTKTGWHHWKRGGEHWELLYEDGTVTAARRMDLESGQAEPTDIPENGKRQSQVASQMGKTATASQMGKTASQMGKTATLNVPGSRGGTPRKTESAGDGLGALQKPLTFAGEGAAAKRSSQMSRVGSQPARGRASTRMSRVRSTGKSKA